MDIRIAYDSWSCLSLFRWDHGWSNCHLDCPANNFILTKGLESDKRFLKKIYSQIDEYRSLNPEIDDAEIMNKIIKSNFPKIKQPVIDEIISDSEDLEEMIYKATEYDETGKIKKPYPPENLDDLDDLEDF